MNYELGGEEIGEQLDAGNWGQNTTRLRVRMKNEGFEDGWKGGEQCL